MLLFSRAARTVFALTRGRSGASLLGNDGRGYSSALSGYLCYLLGLWSGEHHELFFQYCDSKIKVYDKSKIR
jgi:hypothetical protein